MSYFPHASLAYETTKLLCLKLNSRFSFTNIAPFASDHFRKKKG